MAKIVVVSDDYGLRHAVESGLQDEDGELVALGSRKVEEEESVLTTESPDLVMLDMRLSSGAQILSRFAGFPTGGDVSVIACGEYQTPGERAADLDRGASDVLSLPFDPMELVATFRAQMRIKKRLDQLKAEAVIDELTGVYNRRFMESQLVAKLGEAWRYHHPFSFMILDLDHFKRVNDTLGHPFGDLVLRETAMLMRRMIRKEDIVARYGGEEFAMILPHTDRAGVAVLGERVRRAIAEQSFTQGDRQHQVTISIGAATYPRDETESVEELVHFADQRLYLAKELGRNRVIFE